MVGSIMKISLNLFTNCTATAPDVSTILNTYNSFQATFGIDLPVTVYMDINPHEESSDQYYANLKNHFKNVIPTTSLSDGYVRSIEYSDADYLFQLEHDWQFNNNIEHTLHEIIELMSVLGVYHFRFNKRANVKAGWDKDLKESEYMDFKYCITDILSNNPHIIDRRRYKSDIIKYIQICEGSKGIEEKLSRIGLSGLIYGGLNYPATVTHTDGRKCI